MRVTAADRVRAFFVENLGLKVLSLVVAATLFFLVRGAEQHEVAFSVELEVLIRGGERKVLLSEVPDRVNIHLRGTPSVLSALGRGSIPALSVSVRPDQRRVVFDASAVQVPGGVNVVGIEPRELNLEWADLQNRMIGVRPRTVGDVMDGHILAGAIAIEPSLVQLSGPSAIVGGQDHLLTQPLDLSGLGVGRYQREVLVDSPSGRLQVSPSSVVLTFEIIPELTERVMERLEIAVLVPGRTVRPGRVRVVLRGPPLRLRALGSDDVVPVVEPPGDIDATVVPVRVRPLPGGVEVLRIEPSDVVLLPARR